MCERCGAPAAQLTLESTRHEPRRTMRCGTCNHGWFVPAARQALRLVPKADRRRDW
jgi:hypothetical protein